MIYSPSSGFAIALRAAVDGYFRETGRSPRGDWRVHVKSVLLLLGLGISYALLCFAAQRLWQAVPLAIVVGLCMAGIGFNVGHDGNHGAFSASHRGNRIASWALDLVGGSSWVWRVKHNAAHHAYPNIDELDDDVSKQPLARLSPWQRHRPWHRFQHLYLWLLYFTLGMKWQLIDDFAALWRGRVAGQSCSPRSRELAEVLAGKLVFFALAFFVPALFHPLSVVIGCYVLAAGTLGCTISVVFQLAHCVPSVQFYAQPLPGGTALPHSWAEHQVRTTSNFACENKLLGLLIGGLNFQVEHHLFPRVCHVHYPALRPLVRAICARFSVPYHEHDSLLTAVRAHGRWLRILGCRQQSREGGLT